MTTTIHKEQVWAMTGGVTLVELDYDRGFFSSTVLGSIDAPGCVPAGFTTKHVFEGETNVVGSVVAR